jgi:hypothetical protein
MPKVRRLDTAFHIEDDVFGSMFDIEDGAEKASGFRRVENCLHLEQRRDSAAVALGADRGGGEAGGDQRLARRLDESIGAAHEIFLGRARQVGEERGDH